MIHLCEGDVRVIHLCEGDVAAVGEGDVAAVGEGDVRVIHLCEGDVRVIHLCEGDVAAVGERGDDQPRRVAQVLVAVAQLGVTDVGEAVPHLVIPPDGETNRTL